MCTRTSKNKGQSGRRLNTLVAFFEFSFKILKSFWDLYFFFCQKISKMVQFWGARGFLEHKNSCYFMHWWFMKRIMMMFSYWIPEVRFWIAQNYSRKTTSRSCFDRTELKIRPFYEKMTENDWTMRTCGSLIFGLGKNPRQCLKNSIYRFWFREFLSF